ncbi:MAG TPA: GDP-mannose 4,6-dehydratase [Candidatus Omnitrophota bacterium]|nr:GDP-mannose 4,6-dehydratase [Candidatus Omnitrophota bacterium]HPD85581.1 GDP-mannose 4,6-dehydratase [Candidatus Omnitrophota bacterium]HRZ04379.1 GDP-mannose 4,6-dehydratase [Candidatus Omnitrophota bacterium]
MSKRIVVIGSNSFSGSDFIDLLLDEKENEIIGISRSPEKSDLFLPYKRRQTGRFNFYQMDLNKDMDGIRKLLDSFKPEYIVNFAAQSEVAPSWEHPEQWFMTNVVALSRLGDHLKKAKYLRRYVHISSPEVYGTCRGVVKEDYSVNPSTPYAASKAAGDLFLFTLVKNYNFPLVTIRSTNVYGAHQQLFKIIPRTVISIKMGKKIYLHGGGKAVKSYIHIRDISKGEKLAMEKGKNGEIYHLSPKSGIAVKDVVKTICQMMGVDFKKATQAAGERLGQDAAYVIDSTKARKAFGWKPAVSVEEGLGDVIDWVEGRWERIKKEPLEYIHKP